ncbi:MAG: hypothetical protein U9R34_07740 [Nanoarchaeota archaeon]|nr:hypothetical protein [Nanoarchaeota archaeon]
MKKPSYTKESLIRCLLSDIEENKCRMMFFNDSTSFNIKNLIEDVRQRIPAESEYKQNGYLMCNSIDNPEKQIEDIEKTMKEKDLQLMFINDPHGKVYSSLTDINLSRKFSGLYSVAVNACIGTPDIGSIVVKVEEENAPVNFPVQRDMAREYAEILWSSEAIDFTLEDPFYVGKNRSPFYIYSEMMIGHPRIRNKLLDDLVSIAGKLEYDIIAGGETRGMPFSSHLAERLSAKEIFVRKNIKKNMRSRIECLPENYMRDEKVLFVSDTIGYGDTTFDFINAIRQAGGSVKNCIVICDRFQNASQKFQKSNINLIALTNIDTLIDVGVEKGYISVPEFSEIMQYRNNEQEWHKKRGFCYKD